MKCSMMCKRHIILSLLFCLALLLPGRASAEEPSFPDGTAELLLVHSDRMTADVQQQVERLVNMVSAMGRTVDFGTQQQCASVLEQYKYVILYDLDSFDADFGAALKRSDSKPMIIGGETLRQYLLLIGREGRIREEELHKKGKLTYSFPTGRSYECIVQWDSLFSLRTDGYESGTIQAGSLAYPFCTQVVGARFVPVMDLDNAVVRAALMQEITYWMWPYQARPRDYAQFLVLDSVYPFMPAQQLLDIIDRVEQLDIPYILSVMPLSDNSEYPAMKQFCQVLAYAQSRGATIILHAPIIHKNVEDVQELYDRLTDMTNAYIENGVYPVGIEVPYSWLNREPYLTALGRYRTVFVYEDGAAHFFNPEAHTSLISRQRHQLVFPRTELDQDGISQLQCYSSATYVDCGSDAERFLRCAELSKTGGIPLADLRDYTHRVWLNDRSLSYPNGSVYLDGIMQNTTFHPAAYETDFDFHRSALERMSVDLRGQNRILLAGVLILLVIFLTSIFYARRRMHKRFFSDQSGKEE